MHNLIFDEMQAEQVRKERMAEAEAHNKAVRYGRKKFSVEFYCVLAKFVPFLRKWAEGMNKRPTSPVLNKEHN